MAKLTVLMGAPGAGKSTWAAGKGEVVTNDAARGNPGHSGEVLHQAYRRINQLLAAGRDVVFDTTAANANIRKAALGIARRYGAAAEVHVIDAPVDTCIRSQRGRQAPVAAADVRRIHADIQRQIPQLKREGFANIRITRRNGP